MSFGLVWVVFNDFIGAVISGIGAIFPDWIEGKDYESERWRRKHRTFSHYLFGWLLVLGLILILGYLRFKGFPWEVKGSWLFEIGLRVSKEVWVWLLMFYIGFYFVLGSILHVLEDALTGKVPFLNPWRRSFGVRLFSVGSLSERVFVIVFLVCVGLIFWGRK
jgi:inner membrane protein